MLERFTAWFAGVLCEVLGHRFTITQRHSGVHRFRIVRQCSRCKAKTAGAQ